MKAGCRSNNQLKIGVILSYLQIGLNVIIQLAYTPIMIRLLGKSEYGLYNLVGSVVSYLSLFSLGFTGSYLRFSTIKRKENNKNILASFNGLYLLLFLIMSFVALLCGIILTLNCEYIFGSKLTISELKTAKILMIILVVNISLTFPSSVFNSMIAANERYIFQKTVSIIGTVVNPLVVLPLLLNGMGSVAVVLVTTIITVFQLFVNCYYCFIELHVQIRFKEFDWSILKEMALFSFFLFLNMIIDQINWTVDKLILGNIMGTDAVAEYGVGSQINTMIVSFSTAISSVFSPRVNKIAVYSNKKENEFNNLFIKVGRIQFMIVFFLISGFIFFGKYFVERIYAGNGYEDSYFVALLLIMPGIIPLIQNLGIEIQRAVNKHYFRSVIYFAMSLINILISIFLARIYGAVGAALGTSISLLLMNGLVMNIYYHKVIGLDIIRFWKNIRDIFVTLIIPLIVGILCNVLVNTASLLTYFVLIIIYSIVYICFLLKKGINESEKVILKGVFSKFRWITIKK